MLYERDFKRIENHFFTKDTENKSGRKPRLIFVFSSPGAGKSTSIKPVLQRSFSESKPVALEIDELKALISDGTNVDAVRLYFVECIKKAIAEKRSLIIFRQRSMLEPNLTKHIYKTAKDNGYETQATFLALDKKRSRLGMIYRYEQALKKTMESGELDIKDYPRKPEFIKHYMFFKMIPITAMACSKTKSIDIVNVYDREGNLLAENDRLTKNKIGNGILEAIHRERSRKWSDWEVEKFRHSYKESESSMKSRASGFIERIKLKFFAKSRTY